MAADEVALLARELVPLWLHRAIGLGLGLGSELGLGFALGLEMPLGVGLSLRLGLEMPPRTTTLTAPGALCAWGAWGAMAGGMAEG